MNPVGGDDITLTMETIPTTVVEGYEQYKCISVETLRTICPEALVPFDTGKNDNTGGLLESDDLNTIWIMTEKPELLSKPQEELDEEGNYDREEWTQTNEPELAEWLAEQWDRYAVTFVGQKFIILCRTLDDEGGLFWSNQDQEWINYAF